VKPLLSISCFALVGLLSAQQPPPLPPESTPKDVRDFIRTAAEALTNKDATDFLDRFDGKMPGFDTLNFYIQALVTHDAVLSSIEIVTDKSEDKDDRKQRAMLLDWILTIDSDRSRRQLVNVRIERQGKKWKFTSLDPVDFFKPPS